MSLVERDGLLVEPCGYAGCSVCDADESSPDVSADLSDVEWAEYDSLTEAQDRTCQEHQAHLSVHELYAQTLVAFTRGPARVLARIDANTRRTFWHMTLGDLLFLGALILWLSVK